MRTGLALLVGSIISSMVAIIIGGYSPNSVEILATLVGLVLVFPLAHRIIKGRVDIFEPIVIAFVALALMFVARPFAILSHGQYYHYGFNIKPYLTEAMFIALVGVSAFVAGYHSILGRRLGSHIGPLVPDWNSQAAILYAILIFSVGIMLYGVFLVQAEGFGGLAYLLQGRVHGQDQLYRSSSGLFYQAPLLGIPATLITLSTGIKDSKPLPIILSPIFIVPVFVISSAQGGRSQLLLFLSLVIAPFLLTKRRPNWALVAVLAYVSLTIGIGFLGDSRNADLREEPREQLLWRSISRPDQALDRLLEGGDADMIDTLANIVSIIPEELAFSPGSTVKDVFVRVIPRPLWPDKPVEANDALVSTMWPAHYEVSRASPASSFIGNLYLDFGLVSVVVGMLVLGLAAQALWTWRVKLSDNLSVQMVFASAAPLLVVLLRGTLPNAVAYSIFTLVPLLIGLKLAQQSHTHSRREGLVETSSVKYLLKSSN